MPETVPVNPDVLNWAIDRSGIAQDEIERAIPRLPRWLDRSLRPTRRQLETFARKTHTPLGYLFLEKPPEESLPLPDFRTKPAAERRRPSPDLLESIYTIQARKDWLSEYLQESVQPLAAFMEHAEIGSNETPATIAAAMRAKLDLQEGWAAKVPTWEQAFDYLRDAAQSSGVFTFINSMVGNNVYRMLDPEEFRGFVLTDHYAPMVFINGADAKSAQMFTLAHELAHLWLNLSGLFDLPKFRSSSSAVETRCNRIAAEFLVPSTEMEGAWGRARVQANPYVFLARQFKVSPVVIALRAADLGFVERSTFEELFTSAVAPQIKKKKKGGGDFYRNQNQRVGRRFARIVMNAAKSGRLLYRDAYRLTGLHGATFDKYGKELGIEF